MTPSTRSSPSRLPLWLLALVLAAAGTRPAVGQLIEPHDAKVTASDGKTGDDFGMAVALSGAHALVGTSMHDALTGAVYCYEDSGGAWSEVQILVPAGVGPGDGFGVAVAVDGNTAVAGAPGESTGGIGGAAYVFDWNGSQWVQAQRLADSDSGDAYGSSVSLAGGVLAVGAFNDAADGRGAVCVYRFNGTTWSLEQTLTASDAASWDQFGWSVATDGAVIAVGAVTDDDKGIDSGSVYLFRFDGQQWIEEQKLSASDTAGGDSFGWRVAADGDRVVAGTTLNDVPLLDCGSAYVFHFDGTSWSEEQKLSASDPLTYGEFGMSVDIDGDRIVVGSRSAKALRTYDGAAYTFHRDGNGWREVQKRVPGDEDPKGSSPSLHGQSIALDGGRVLVGAMRAGGRQPDAGGAYFHDWYDLALDADPDSVKAGQTLTLLTGGGLPGAGRALFLTDVNGAPFVSLLDFGLFDAAGQVGFGGVVPPGLSGTTAGFLAFGIWSAGSLAVSNPVQVSFQ